MSVEKLPPWKRKKKKSGAPKKLSPAQVAAARERAAKAKRRYPNLVDNMWAAKQKPEDLKPRRDADSFDPDA